MPETHLDVCILQPGYFPWLGYFDQAKMADVFVLYDDIQFDKGGWRKATPEDVKATERER